MIENIKTEFDTFRMTLPTKKKNLAQMRHSWLFRTEDAIVVRLSNKVGIKINKNGTWTQE
jgi:hypothetical protein